ncbi:carbohydrate porin [soil metagenome]
MNWLGGYSQQARPLAAVAFAIAAVIGSGARAEEAEPQNPPLTLGLTYQLDTVGTLRGGLERGSGVLDNLTLSAFADLDRMVGWKGGSAQFDLISTGGDTPSALAGALQGVDGIEVTAHRLRLYQAWIEQDLAGGRANLRLGFSDVSGEFAGADASGLLLNPSFGMAPDFAASGASAFPSTSIGARLRLAPSDHTYVQAAVVNARTGVPGDEGGADFSFADGEVVMVEAGATGRGKIAVGAWRMTSKQDDLAELDPSGQPLRRTAQGAYLLVEQPLSVGQTRATTAFLRAGLADGRTSPFRGSLQAGLLVTPVFAVRPDSSLTIGVTYAALSQAYRDASVLAGAPSSDHGETVLEIAYSDQIASKVRLQPDLQWVHRPGGDGQIKDALVATLRLELAL